MPKKFGVFCAFYRLTNYADYDIMNLILTFVD